MKYKKQILILVTIVAFIIGINNAYAKEKIINNNHKDNVVQNINVEKNIKLSGFMNFAAIKEDKCVPLFGDKDDEESISYLIHQVLDIPKIVVPILIIVLGTLDFAKAVLASKEDEMRKSQATFIKRVLIGITIFFVPTILDIIMYFADFVLEGTMCSI